MLKWGSTKGSVELSFEVYNKKYKVKRMLHSSSVSLKGPNVDISKSKEASDFIASLIKADSDILKISSFMPQSGANELIFGTKTERQKSFSRLFRLLHLEMRRADLQKEFNKIPVYPDVTDLITNLVADLEFLKISRDDMPDKEAELKYIEDNKKRYQAMYDARDCKYTKAEYKSKLDDMQAELSVLELRHDSIAKKIQELPELVFVPPEDTEQYRGFKIFEQVCIDMLAAQEEYNNLTPVEEVQQSDIDVLTEEIEKCNIDKAQLEQKCNLWKRGKCGECGSVFEHTEAEIADLVKQISEIVSSVEDLINKRNTKKNLRDSWVEYSRKKADAKERLDKLKKTANDQATLYADYNEEAYLNKQKSTEGNAALQKLRSDLENDLKTTSHNISLIKENIAAHKASKYRPDDFCTNFLNEYQKAVKDMQDNAQKRASIETAIKIKEDQLSLRRKEASLAKIADEHRKFISDLRTILHVDNYPRLAVSVYKEKLSSLINKYLDLFNQRFTVHINDSLEFVCAFPDNPKASADESLSGGQKGMLLVSCRLAIAEMLASDVELLTFDEPGAAMDKDAKEGLLEAFDTVRKYLTGRRIQMLIASHDDKIEGIADGIIQL
jgi:DNA repair exonuclease SbcCD ATPase subunit